MDRVYIGAHVSMSGKNKDDIMIEVAEYIKDIGCNLIQIFNVKGKSDKEINEYKKFMEKNNMKTVVHSSYVINIATKWDKYSWWIRTFISEIEQAHKLGAFGIVIHLGKKMEQTLPQAYDNMFTALIYVHNQTKQYSDVKILIETSSGQGTETCYKIEDLAYFYKKISKHYNKEISNRFGLCIDTCHIFVAGYNIKTKEQVKMYLQAFDELIGLRHVKLIHLNDSQNDVGSNVDRHANIGKGYIGTEGIMYFCDYFKKLKVPIVLETPDIYFDNDIKLITGGI